MRQSGTISKETLNFLSYFAICLTWVWGAMVTCALCYSIARTIRKIIKIKDKRTSFLKYIALGFQKGMQSSLAYYCSDKPLIQYILWGLFWVNSTSSYQLAILALNDLFSSLINYDAHQDFLPVISILGGIFYTLYYVQHCFLLQIICRKQEYLHKRPDASSRSNFTMQERKTLVRISISKAFQMVALTILMVVVPMIPDLVSRHGAQMFFTRKVYLYFILFFSILTFYALQTKKYLNYEGKFLEYQAECSKLDLKAAAVISFLRNYNPCLIIKNSEIAEADSSEVKADIISKIPFYLLKFEEHISIIETQSYRPLPQNTREISVVPRAYVYIVLGLVVGFAISTITLLISSVPEIFFLISASLSYIVMILALPIIMSLMNLSIFIYGELPEDINLTKEIGFSNSSGQSCGDDFCINDINTSLL